MIDLCAKLAYILLTMRLLLAFLCLSLSGCSGVMWNITSDGKTVRATIGGTIGTGKAGK